MRSLWSSRDGWETVGLLLLGSSVFWLHPVGAVTQAVLAGCLLMGLTLGR